MCARGVGLCMMLSGATGQCGRLRATTEVRCCLVLAHDDWYADIGGSSVYWMLKVCQISICVREDMEDGNVPKV